MMKEILRTIFNQKLNEEGNIIDTDGDEGLAISLVTEIIEPKQLSFKDSKKQIVEKLKLKNRLKRLFKNQKKLKKILKMES